MWKEYSSGYLKNNRAAGAAILLAAFISALLLSLLCSLFYNAWKYETERIRQKEGDWQSRITGTFSPADIEAVQNLPEVKKAAVTSPENAKEEPALELVFAEKRQVFAATPKIAEMLGAPTEAVDYHYGLLALYLIRSPQDRAPRLLFPLFLLVTGMASLSLIVIIHNSFAVSMQARLHQFGILSSIGATPKQIRTCLLQEAAALCALPVILGNLLGIAGSIGILELINRFLGSRVADRQDAVFGYHPLVFVLTFLVTGITIWISAWLPARKLSRLTPLEAIRNTKELQLFRKKSAPVLGLLFGPAGELAGNALKAQRKALRMATLSLVFSFLAFTLIQCFFTLSGISTRETYFERYQQVWDIMVTVQNTEVDTFSEIEKLRALPGVRSAVAYQKAAARTVLGERELSEEMKAFGGFDGAEKKEAEKRPDGWRVNVPLVILDDDSFIDYCRQIGITPRLDGAVIRNLIRDVTNPDFRHPVYLPYVTGKTDTRLLLQEDKDEAFVTLPVLACTDEVPALREEYATTDHYELVHMIPAALWKKIRGQSVGSPKETYICVLGRENVTVEELDALQEKIGQTLGSAYGTESENRIRQRQENDSQIQGMLAIFGGFCVLLALIGIGNVFSNTLGFVRQRKREFARYLSVGLTPVEIRKMFCIEALVLAGRPILITVLLAVPIVGFFLKASYLETGAFLAEAPLLPIAAFMLAIAGTVALAYYLGWRKLRCISLAEVLRDDTML